MLIKSYAKINLFLEVLGKRADNYHKIESLICFLDLYDEIKIEKNGFFQLQVSGDQGNFLVGNRQENIITKTVLFMSEQFNFRPNLKISLTKNIPIGAGLGGGSSNSAAIILAINEIYNLKLTQEQILEIALKMGCDAPICLNKNMALVSGIGEKISSIKTTANPAFCLIVNPNIHLATAAVFQSLKIKENNKNSAILANQDIIEYSKNRKNDLENTAIKLAPEIALILDELQKQNNCLLARMSGSGSTCFALFHHQDELENAYANLVKKFPDFYIKKSKLIYEK